MQERKESKSSHLVENKKELIKIEKKENKFQVIHYKNGQHNAIFESDENEKMYLAEISNTKFAIIQISWNLTKYKIFFFERKNLEEQYKISDRIQQDHKNIILYNCSRLSEDYYLLLYENAHCSENQLAQLINLSTKTIFDLNIPLLTNNKETIFFHHNYHNVENQAICGVLPDGSLVILLHYTYGQTSSKDWKTRYKAGFGLFDFSTKQLYESNLTFQEAPRYRIKIEAEITNTGEIILKSPKSHIVNPFPHIEFFYQNLKSVIVDTIQNNLVMYLSMLNPNLHALISSYYFDDKLDKQALRNLLPLLSEDKIGKCRGSLSDFYGKPIYQFLPSQSASFEKVSDRREYKQSSCLIF